MPRRLSPVPSPQPVRVVFVMGPAAGRTAVVAGPPGRYLAAPGGWYLITSTATVHGYVAEWRPR